MIPTMLIAGFLIGFFLKGRIMLAGLLIASALWASLPLLGLSDADLESFNTWNGAFIFGAANTAFGVAIGFYLRISLKTVRTSR